jgi:hypothetical protein
MRNTILAGALALGALAGAPRRAAADCVIDAVESCDRDFGGNSNYYTIAIRGWCYIIRTGLCKAIDSGA